MAPEKRIRQSRNAEVIEKAVIAVRKKDMSIRQASKQFNIPFETLRRHASGEAKSTTLGRPPKFDREMESELRETVKEMLNMGHGVGLEEVKELGMELCASSGLEPFKKEMPSRGWARGFMARNNLTLKSAENTSDIPEASRDTDVVKRAMNTLTNGGSPSKQCLDHHALPQEMHSCLEPSNPLNCPSDFSEDVEPQASDIEGEVLYVGHMVESGDDTQAQGPELCSVELKECNEDGVELCASMSLDVSEDRAGESSNKNSSKTKLMTKRRCRSRRDSKEIERAIYAINHKQISIRQASKHFNIPFETLRRYVVEESKKNTLNCSLKHARKSEIIWKTPVNEVLYLGHSAEMGGIQELGKELCETVFMEPFTQELPPRNWEGYNKAKSNLSFVSDNSSKFSYNPRTEFKLEHENEKDSLQSKSSDQ